MKKYDVIIAIDPDVEKSGVALLEVETRKLEVSSYTFQQLFDYLTFIKEENEKHNKKIVVVVEASWTTTHNYHLSGKHTLASASKTGYNIGRNHQQGMVICEMAKHYGFEVIEHAPLRKCWKGKDGKITHEELASFTGLIGKTNQDSRDAALLAWNYANFPIKIKNF